MELSRITVALLGSQSELVAGDEAAVMRRVCQCNMSNIMPFVILEIVVSA